MIKFIKVLTVLARSYTIISNQSPIQTELKYSGPVGPFTTENDKAKLDIASLVYELKYYLYWLCSLVVLCTLNTFHIPCHFHHEHLVP